MFQTSAICYHNCIKSQDRGSPVVHECSELARKNAASGVIINGTTAATRCCGERIGYDLTISGLCLQEDAAAACRAQDVSAETRADP